MERINNEIKAEFVSTIGNNPFVGNNSASRHYMFGQQLTQRVITDKSDPNRIQTGVEDEFGKYTFSVSMPEDGTIIDIIDRYPKTGMFDSISENPFTLVVYERHSDKTVCCFTLPVYKSLHQYFGFKYKATKSISRLVRGNFIEKGVIFADTPAKREDGTYCQGVELNVALMSHPAVVDDGVALSDRAAERLGFKLIEKARIATGSSSFPLNLYGDSTTYKPWPDIGEYIREDGLLMVNRPYDYDMAPVDMGPNDVKEIRYGFDRPEYVRSGKGRVIDIIVRKDKNAVSPMPPHMEKSMEKYIRALDVYHTRIVELDEKLSREARRKYGDATVKYSPELHNIIVNAMAMTDKGGEKSSEKLHMLYKKTPVDNYVVEFVIEYSVIPDIGFKTAGKNGD